MACWRLFFRDESDAWHEHLGHRFVPAVCGAKYVMNIVCRQRWVAVCLLSVLFTGFHASAQFLDAEIIAAPEISVEMRAKILELVAPATKKIASAEPAEVSSGRNTLLTPFRDVSASTAFKDTFSELITPRLAPAVSHESVLVRINAMIVLAKLTDEPSMKLIDKGLEDENVAVRRKATEALRSRVRQYLLMPGGNARAVRGIKNAIGKVDALLSSDPPPHPIVVRPAMLILVDIATNETHTMLAGHLNNRVAMHAAKPGQGFAGEIAALNRLTGVIKGSRTLPLDLAKAVNRAAFRYATLTVDQLIKGKLNEADSAEAAEMLDQCLKSLAIITIVAEKNVPEDHSQATGWLKARDWNNVVTLVAAGWTPILKAQPFSLTDEQLKVQSK